MSYLLYVYHVAFYLTCFNVVSIQRLLRDSHSVLQEVLFTYKPASAASKSKEVVMGEG